MTEQEILDEDTILKDIYLLTLIDQIRRINKVVQVRYSTVLKTKTKEESGQDAVAITVFVKENQTLDNDKFIQLSSIIQSSIWKDATQHQVAIDNITNNVNSFVQSGIIVSSKTI